MDEPRTRRKKVATEKCPRCHSYFVEPGEICSNCQKKEESGQGMPNDQHDAE